MKFMLDGKQIMILELSNIVNNGYTNLVLSRHTIFFHQRLHDSATIFWQDRDVTENSVYSCSVFVGFVATSVDIFLEN